MLNKKAKQLLLVILLFYALGAEAASANRENVALSQNQIDEYYATGILIIPNFFNKQEIEQVSLCANRLQMEADKLSQEQTGKVMHKGTQFVIDKKNNKLQIHRIVWVGSAEPQLLKLGRQLKILVPVGQLLGSTEADHLINQLHFKLPNDEVKFDWHQDIKNRRNFDPNWQDVNQKGSFVQTIIAIDPMTEKNGAIYYVPKSHTRGDLFLDKITDAEELKKIGELDKAIPLLLNPGDIVFMHPYLIHGSQPNESSMSRRAFINGFSYPGANKQPYPGEGSAQRIVLQ